MIQQIFALRDAKVEAFMRPFFCRSKGEAIRTISDYAAEENSPLHRHPEDYMLFQLGAYSEGSGEIRGLDQPEPVISVLELMTDRPLDQKYIEQVKQVRKLNGLPELPGQAELEDAIAAAVDKKL